MNHQQQLGNPDTSDSITTQEAIDLLFGSAWLEETDRIEDEENYSLSAGLDWGNKLPHLMLNLPLFSRLSTLRVSLNREAKLIIEAGNLGIGTSSAIITATEIIKERLLSPASEIIPHLEAILLKDELYTEEFISDRQSLQALLVILLTDADRERIAEKAANSIRLQIMSQMFLNQPISA